MAGGSQQAVSRRIVVLYASNSGNTMQAAEIIGRTLAGAGFSVDVIDAALVGPDHLPAADFWVLGSNTWLREGQQGELPTTMHRMVDALVSRKTFAGRPCAVFAFGRHEYTKFCGAADHLEEAVATSGGYLVTDTLRVDGFIQQNREAVEAWADKLATAARSVDATAA